MSVLHSRSLAALLCFLTGGLLAIPLANLAAAEDPNVLAAEKLLKTTVTVRMLGANSLPVSPAASPEFAKNAAPATIAPSGFGSMGGGKMQNQPVPPPTIVPPAARLATQAAPPAAPPADAVAGSRGVALRKSAPGAASPAAAQPIAPTAAPTVSAPAQLSAAAKPAEGVNLNSGLGGGAAEAASSFATKSDLARRDEAPSTKNYYKLDAAQLADGEFKFKAANVPDARGEEVSVCSGVAVGRSLVVTANPSLATPSPTVSRYRVTLPDGEQSKATLRVVDHYSGLSLLETEATNLPVLTLAAEPLAIGSTVLTAAASGIERPVVSAGIVSGIDRSLSGSDFPPLIQCDVSTTETSCGAAFVDRSGQLVGIIVATGPAGQRSGWTYAVPARHVQRLLDALEKQPLEKQARETPTAEKQLAKRQLAENQAVDRLAGNGPAMDQDAANKQQVVVLERRRPVIGLTLGPGNKEGTVEVERVVPGGPADIAGLKPGERLIEAEGRKIRSAYQAVDLILNRQPGEKIRCLVENGSERRTVDITLAGSVEPAKESRYQSLQADVGPQVNVRALGGNQFEVRNRAANLGIENEQLSQRSPGDEVSMLRAQLVAFEKVILRLQAELQRRDALQAENDETFRTLRSQVDELRRQVEAKR